MYFDSEIITSRNNQLVKWAASLADKKNRKESGYFMAEGVKLTKEAFAAGLPVDYCIVTESKKAEMVEFLSTFKGDEKYEKCRVITVSESVFEKISTEKAPQGVISIIKHLDFFRELDIIYKEELYAARSPSVPTTLCSAATVRIYTIPRPSGARWVASSELRLLPSRTSHHSSRQPTQARAEFSPQSLPT